MFYVPHGSCGLFEVFDLWMRRKQVVCFSSPHPVFTVLMTHILTSCVCFSRASLLLIFGLHILGNLKKNPPCIIYKFIVFLFFFFFLFALLQGKYFPHTSIFIQNMLLFLSTFPHHSILELYLFLMSLLCL